MSPAQRFAAAYEPKDDVASDRSAAASVVKDALRESVRYHLVSDVPVGVFLSGGIDSSAVAALASEVSARPLDTFTVTFSEKDYSEAATARETAKRLGQRITRSRFRDRIFSTRCLKFFL
jgi:Asparagine synthase (glutamine-hydrolyzing)